jgi:hypothetical protein
MLRQCIQAARNLKVSGLPFIGSLRCMDRGASSTAPSTRAGIRHEGFRISAIAASDWCDKKMSDEPAADWVVTTEL